MGKFGCDLVLVGGFISSGQVLSVYFMTIDLVGCGWGDFVWVARLSLGVVSL